MFQDFNRNMTNFDANNFIVGVEVYIVIVVNTVW